MLDDYLYSNHYYQKKVNLDPERCQINLERAIRRKHRETQVIVDCQHRNDDWCQISNIPYDELEDFHDGYWNCVGTVNKRVFVAQYLNVKPVCHEDRKKDLNITCYCPRRNGSFDLICQKSFISVLGVSKHKVLAIGRAKLLNSEQLFKETRGGRRRKNKENSNDKWDLENSTIDSNQSEICHGNGNNINNYNYNNEDEIGENEENSESKSEEINVLQSNIKLVKTFNYAGEFEQNIKTNESNYETKKVINDDNDSNDSDIEICSPIIPTIHIAESNYNSSNDDNEEDNDDDNNIGNMFEPNIEMKESESILSTTTTPVCSQTVQLRIEPRNEIYIRKKTQQLPHLLRQFNTKTTAASGSAIVRPQKYEIVKIQINNEINEQKKINAIEQQRSTTNNKQPYFGPTNWQKTIERNRRRLQREREVSVSCTHNKASFCKILCIPTEDLVNYHQEYWSCNGIVEERIFLARYLIVEPRSHRREMTIVHRIPASDGIIYEVCQKSFLSVVGITKHKVQAAARAVLRGELFKKDGRGGSKVKCLKHIENTSTIEYNNNDDNEHLISDRDNNSNYNKKKACSLQIAQVIGNYKPGMNGMFNMEIKTEPAIEIQDSNDYNSSYSYAIENIHNFQMINNNNVNNNFIKEKPFIEESGSSKQNNKNILIKNNKINFLNKYKKNQIERNYFKFRNKKLLKDRKRLFQIISRLRMENIQLKNRKNN